MASFAQLASTNTFAAPSQELGFDGSMDGSMERGLAGGVVEDTGFMLAGVANVRRCFPPHTRERRVAHAPSPSLVCAPPTSSTPSPSVALRHMPPRAAPNAAAFVPRRTVSMKLVGGGTATNSPLRVIEAAREGLPLRPCAICTLG